MIHTYINTHNQIRINSLSLSLSLYIYIYNETC